ncbi:light-harvesting antenna LH1, alpha subunit [Novosphingopyxis sp. YJ-S2-01]|uniref:light-harvesting antenna LH1, alpha subunit n=1 Tax=Novosphingopyxis sp. YJ-S2-01 TaxID=2794021 RepID=UPI0018DD9936|nr:light-harvesting antenna LH1, alpha subunit [Novosphingopyxis sp. YJ-S2-01]MBH9536775.1 light-harvesting protein [Novosphingopyxis sp. YJ-S2-01]
MRLWMIFDPRRALIGLFAFLLVLALLIHFILLGTEKYNWLDSSSSDQVEAVAIYPAQPMAPMGPAAGGEMAPAAGAPATQSGAMAPATNVPAGTLPATSDTAPAAGPQ